MTNAQYNILRNEYFTTAKATAKVLNLPVPQVADLEDRFHTFLLESLEQSNAPTTTTATASENS